MPKNYIQKNVGIETLFLSPLRRSKTTPAISQELISLTEQYGPQIPVIVREQGTRHYEILANAETWLAAQRVGIYQVPITIRTDVSDTEARYLVNEATLENPIDEALRFQRTLKEQFEQGIRGSVTKVAQTFNKSRSYVSHSLRLLQLPDSVQDALRAGEISRGHAKALLSCQSDTELLHHAKTTVARQLSVRETEQLVRGRASVTKKAVMLKEEEEEKSHDLKRLEQQLTEIVGCQVSINMRKGTLEIDYCADMDILDGVLSRLGYQGE